MKLICMNFIKTLLSRALMLADCCCCFFFFHFFSVYCHDIVLSDVVCLCRRAAAEWINDNEPHSISIWFVHAVQQQKQKTNIARYHWKNAQQMVHTLMIIIQTHAEKKGILFLRCVFIEKGAQTKQTKNVRHAPYESFMRLVRYTFDAPEWCQLLLLLLLLICLTFKHVIFIHHGEIFSNFGWKKMRRTAIDVERQKNCLKTWDNAQRIGIPKSIDFLWSYWNKPFIIGFFQQRGTVNAHTNNCGWNDCIIMTRNGKRIKKN